jgi:aldehyde:ferredoxin oxidoreductase
MNGINFKLLEVDLTHETSRSIDVTKDVERYLGGRGLGNKLIWDLVPQGADALSEANVLHIGVGPITGLIGTKTILSFKSPLTGWVGRSATSGYFGEEIVKTQYNTGILIKGKAKKPSYLYVYDDRVEIRDATDLWGKWKLETENTLRDRLNQETGQMFGVLCIGPAGENLVRFANASTEFAHSASKWGCGAVMGSKNLKAVCVRGTKGPLYADHQKIWELFKRYAANPWTGLFRLNESRWGHSKSPSMLLRYGGEGIKNNHLGYHEIVKKSNFYEHEMKYHIWTDGCPGCVCGCITPFFKNGKNGAFGGEFRHDDMGGFNANILVGYEEVAEFNGLVDELGMDSEELGGLIAWAMDLYEHNIISQQDLGGIDLKWGSVEATIQLIKKIAYKENLAPATLAEGFRRAYKVFGDKSKWYAYEVHGCASPTSDLRNKELGAGIRNATSHCGARVGDGIMSLLGESATCCDFQLIANMQVWGSVDEAIRQYVNAACGWNLTSQDIADIAQRNYYFNRCISLREGYYPPKDDYFPPRAFDEPITDKYGKVWVWDPDEFEEKKKEFYLTKLKLDEKGLPPRNELERLGLDFIIPTLAPMGAIG